MIMDQLEKLPEITDYVLSGLKADDALKHRILLSAADSSRSSPYRFRTVIALCSLSLLLILLCVFINQMPLNGKPESDIQVIPAGSHRIVSPVNMQQVIDLVSENESETITETNSAE